MSRTVGLVLHERRDDVEGEAQSFADQLEQRGVTSIILDENTPADAIENVELAVVLGGDGTMLRAAEFTRGHRVPLLGVNYGHMGFLAELDSSSHADVIETVSSAKWIIEERMTIDVSVDYPDGTHISNWALNEVSIEKGFGSRMIETDLAVDGTGVSSFKTDAVILSTPTGSTAYNFSAGGPIVWPDVEAIVLIPIAAHALFTRPMVVGPKSRLDIRLRSDDAVLWCDGRRKIHAPEGSIISVYRGSDPVLLARVHDLPFSWRLVTKFRLPVEGWRYDQQPRANGDVRILMEH
ncbi:MAG: NAD kinase [Actinomycetaceae bacterium]|nr:NAD kinase [Arcanobacterium sp.]MDD7504402.1 NAD kinase [Actinomycetaceae bacterium]MDY6143590.1 NAD kinase [Arcanobacterium sp.]